MTTLLIALCACAIGVVCGIFLAAWLDVRQHQREAGAAQASVDAARREFAQRDEDGAAVCRWMAQSYRSAGGVAKPDPPAPAWKPPVRRVSAVREDWVRP